MKGITRESAAEDSVPVATYNYGSPSGSVNTEAEKPSKKMAARLI